MPPQLLGGDQTSRPWHFESAVLIPLTFGREISVAQPWVFHRQEVDMVRVCVSDSDLG